jgi:hypothetical protein
VRSGTTRCFHIPPDVSGLDTVRENLAVAEICTHLDHIHDVAPSGNGCVECLRMGAQWVHLRRCSECGHIGCCDNSPNKHATAHFHETTHPIVQSYEPGEDWYWCYVDDVGFERDDEEPSPSHT